MHHNHDSPIAAQSQATAIDKLLVDDETREALERIQALYKASESRSDHFQSLYSEGKKEQLQEELEDFAYELMESSDNEYQELLR